jgi:hypothetical protein
MADATPENTTPGQLLAWMGMNAERWTQTFLKMTDLENAGPDFRGTVLSWFANALEAGRSAGWSAGWTSQAQGDPGTNELAKRSNETAHEKGWWDSGREFDGVIALIHSEASEALEEWRDNHEVTERYYTVAKYRPEPGSIKHDSIERQEALQEWASLLNRRGNGGYVGASELPDDIAHILVLAGFLKPEGIPSELADIVIRVGDATAEYGIDLAQEILLKQAYNSTRPHKHGGKRS